MYFQIVTLRCVTTQGTLAVFFDLKRENISLFPHPLLECCSALTNNAFHCCLFRYIVWGRAGGSLFPSIYKELSGCCCWSASAKQFCQWLYWWKLWGKKRALNKLALNLARVRISRELIDRREKEFTWPQFNVGETSLSGKEMHDLWV